MTTPDRTPIEEIGKRAAEAGAGLAAAAKAASVQDHVDSMAAYRRRVDDAHLAGMQALGGQPVEVPTVESQEDGAMGSTIVVTGDIYGDKAAETLSRVSGSASPVATEPTTPLTGRNWLAPAAASLLAAVVGAGAALGMSRWLGADAPPVTATESVVAPGGDTDTDTWPSVIVRPHETRP